MVVLLKDKLARILMCCRQQLHFKRNLFITTSFTSLLYQFSILFVIISRLFLYTPPMSQKPLRLFLLETLKHLLRFCILINIGYRLGLLRIMREFPDKRPKTFGLDNIITKLLKNKKVAGA